jgi:transcription termination/antitermination protein NusG
MRAHTTLVRFGEVIGKSEVSIVEGKKLMVIRGPLSGREGRIVQLNKRRRRAKIEISLYDRVFRVDFGLEILTPTGSPGG